ncbi:MAG: DNA double-strand break repair nuclease NurA [Candidatus Aenigmatarchaeota archaeon]|nr:MAG: DNA double-strand break repair nuclease NurA [Candidatus Aenigmarchaeota archaeon]
MERILSELSDAAERVKTLEDKRHRLGLFLREIKGAAISKDAEILEDRMAIPVAADPLKRLRVAGVDGGLVKHAYHAIDLILTRAVAAVFDYADGNLANVTYFPDPLATPRLSVITDPYSEQDFAHAADIERMATEAHVLSNVSTLSPDLVLADGSLVPHPSSRPKKGDGVWPKYAELLELYKRAFASHKLLAGVVEDSRSTHFSEMIAAKVLSRVGTDTKELQDILSRTRDTNLLFHVLKPGERSFVFRLGDPATNAVIADLGEHANNLYAFYLKTVEYDRPIRVEFYAKGDAVRTADKLASLILPISSQNAEYGIPAVIIEADSRAKLREEELTTIHSYIVDRVGDLPSLYKLRRESRPF